ncbi:MAG: hypothetical protein ACUBOA_00215 [Candidatus Loosdrechtia sp.]|uniref:hypothetical protein n=1 Tax=Candidatus Loosdrechtia sp. TaxID=3101272 RepID=UPI003A6A5936|nr:MAG: hypothetical protein QY305_01895 [Candidatus Jettenia sp. AMX2]
MTELENRFNDYLKRFDPLFSWLGIAMYSHNINTDPYLKEVLSNVKIDIEKIRKDVVTQLNNTMQKVSALEKSEQYILKQTRN